MIRSIRVPVTHPVFGSGHAIQAMEHEHGTVLFIEFLVAAPVSAAWVRPADCEIHSVTLLAALYTRDCGGC